MQALKKWFSDLSHREQQMVMLAGVAVLIALFYFVIWSPLHQGLATQKAGLDKEQADLNWVKEQANRAQLLKQSSAQKRFNGSLSQLINQTTRNANISVSRIQPINDDISVSIEEVEFNRLITWLDALERQGVVVVQSDITELSKQGFVNVRRIQLGKA